MPCRADPPPYADRLKEQGGEVTVSVEYAALDPFGEYRNAIRDELPVCLVEALQPGDHPSQQQQQQQGDGGRTDHLVPTLTRSHSHTPCP